MNKWIKDAVFYHIYPISFYDSNGDGEGDLQGIIQKLDYLKDLGINAIWVSPFYKSSFMDGGYDIIDFCSVDERFGTMEDFESLVAKCKQLKIRIIIDLVIGHTSFNAPWFLESAKDEINKYSDYYIWTESNLTKYKDRTIHGLYPRDGGYYINYYACQPALNYGFNVIEKSNDNNDAYSSSNTWQMKYDDERLAPLREEIINVMRFWLNKGIDGFRVDLANSLVKGCKFDSDNDKDNEGMIWLWDRLMSPIRQEYPEVAFVSEWVCPANAVGKCGFDVDFFAHDIECYNDLFRNEKGTNLLPCFEKGYSYFGESDKGDIEPFINYATKTFERIDGLGYFSVPSGSHDQVRISTGKSEDALCATFAFLLTTRHVPFIYYGDELGMSHNFNINKDGGYLRTGARTPMQWDNSFNRGFSTSNKLYLPTNDKTEESVEYQNSRADSLLNTVKTLLKIRASNECLRAEASIEYISSKSGDLLIYARKKNDECIYIAINETGNSKVLEFNNKSIVFSRLSYESKGKITIDKHGFVIYK